MYDNATEGEPGKPGERSVGQQGGKGGEGGRGGAGKPEGKGGAGGEGGRGARGQQGPQGEAGAEGLPPLWKWALTTWIIIFTIVVAWGLAHHFAARGALCASRDDLDIRIARTQALLDETQGEPDIFGIPRTLIEETQSQNRITRANLDSLDDHWYLLSC